MKHLLAATALAAISIGTAANATAFHAVYNLGTLTPAASIAPTTFNLPKTATGTTYSDLFTFDVIDNNDETTTGIATFGKTFGVTDIQFALYNGSTGSGVQVGTTQDVGTAGSYTWSLTPGSYSVVSTVTVAANKTGSYNVSFNTVPSPTPEPVTWALMIAGVALTGGMLRYGRRQSFAAVA